MNGRRAAGALRVATVACGFALACPHAAAVLGGSAATIEADRASLDARHRVTTSSSMAASVHELRSADGSVVKEYAGPDGIVFALRWSTRFKPRLDPLLGAEAASYRDALARAAVRPGIRHALVLQQDDLVVQSGMHLTTHVGIAYLRSRLPSGIRPDDLR